ncbi:MAG TPA: class I SAM-dependent methyltransferase [Ktedonobacterales bacterium]|nr:class I SAM-dependent methyltransferase [Ktedonobacterales bacterium]
MSERERRRAERADLAATTSAIWEANAAFWDERMGEGNCFQRLLVAPATERLLAPRVGERVLEVACGNGVMARRLAELGARVLATDVSPTFIERARARSGALGDRIEYRVVDATSEEALLALGAGEFDAIVCNMALMDMARIEPLMRAARALLRPGADARFVFSVMHPCFNSGEVRFVMEEDDLGGELRTVRAVKISGYLEPDARLGLGMIGQPQPHYYFHRPLSALLGAAFAAGFTLDGLEEPAFEEPEPDARPLSWAQFTSIPPVLAARLRPR